MLKDLINGGSSVHIGKTWTKVSSTASSHQESLTNANRNHRGRLNISEGMPPPPPKTRSPFMSSSAEGMSTRFTEENGGPFRFSAGLNTSDPSPRRARSNGRLGNDSRKSTQTDRDGDSDAGNPNGQQTPASDFRKSGFDAQGWTEKFGPQDFAPQPPKAASQSPTRGSRANSRKPRTRPTMGNAAMTNDSSADDEVPSRPAEPVNVDSPNAMDIDSPPRSHETPRPRTSARNIPVEPSNPNWRAGTAAELSGRRTSQTQSQTQPSPAPFKVPTAGSEDTEEFKAATFAGWNNPNLFTSSECGLKGFAADMKAHLPFESGPSESIPIKQVHPAARSLYLANPPHAPALPGPVGVPGMKLPADARQRYLREFQGYLVKWVEWNARVVDHFVARQKHMAEQLQKEKQVSNGLFSLSTSGAKEQIVWAMQDQPVRASWTRACDEHEKRIEEYAAVLQHH
jgi:hypothetical protein